MQGKYIAGVMGAFVMLGPMAAQGAAPSLDAYGDLPGVEDMAISPDGRTVATVLQVKGERRVAAIDDKNNVLLNFRTGANKVRGIDWADNGTLLVTKTELVPLGMDFTTSQAELTGTIIVAMATKKPELVFARTRAIADTTRGRYGVRQVGGRTMGFFGGLALDVTREGAYLPHARATLYAVDLAKNDAHRVAAPAGEDHDRDWQIDEAGNLAATLDISETNGRWTIVNAKGKELAQGIDQQGNESLLFLGKDGSTLVYEMEDASGDRRWMEVPLAGGTPVEFLPGVGIERAYVDRRNGRLIGYRTKGDQPQTVMFEPAQQSAVTRIFQAFGKRDVTLIDWSSDFSKVLVQTSGNRDSGTWFLVDVAARKADPIGDERETIGPDDVGPISVFAYKAADGLAMDGILTLPPSREAKNLPVVVLPHGGPTAHDTMSFNWWAQAFASRGYAVFQPNFRGSTNRDEAFERAGNGEWGRKMQTDLSDGLTALAQQGIVDPKRACIVGASYGGYAALAGVSLQHGIYRCAVSVAGVSDVEMMYKTDIYESGNSKMTWRVLRNQLGDPKGYDAISPRRFAASVDAPVLLIHGKDDTVVPYKQSSVMADALKDAGKPYQMVALPGEDHWLSQGETRKRMLQASVDFVLKNNPAD